MNESPFRRPLGIALAGGASHGSWQAAALQTLVEEFGLAFDHVLGYSVGALNGAAYVLDLMPENMARWRRTEQGRLLRFAPRLFPPTLFSAEPLWEAVASASDDGQARKRARCPLVVISTCYAEKRPVYSVFEPEGGSWDGPLAAHLVASSAIPRIFPPITTTHRGRTLTLRDGGIPCREPLSFAALSGCRDVIVLEMARPGDRGRETALALMNQGVASLEALPKPPRVFRLRPAETIRFSALSFAARHMEDGLRRGAEDARTFMRTAPHPTLPRVGGR